jgi:hypothetical protein
MLQELGLFMPQIDQNDDLTRDNTAGDTGHNSLEPIAALRHLITECDLYLRQFDGPGVADVRAGLTKFRQGDFTPCRSASHNPVVETHLPVALAALMPTQPALAHAIAAAATHLNWITYDGYPLDEIGPSFATGHAYASLIGTGGHFRADDYDLGVFLIAPHVLYRDHNHAAPELYAPLTGPHGWRFGTDAPLIIKPAHQPIWNEAFAPHLTKVGPTPFLALYGWPKDVGYVAKVIPAVDWAGLEALRIDDPAQPISKPVRPSP